MAREGEVTVGTVDVSYVDLVAPDLAAELERVAAFDPDQVIRKTEDVVHAVGKGLLRIAGGEKATDADEGQAFRGGIAGCILEPQRGEVESAGDGGGGANAVDAEACDVDNSGRDSPGVGEQNVLRTGDCLVSCR